MGEMGVISAISSLCLPCSPQSSVGFAPSELLYGRPVCGPLEAIKHSWTNEDTDEEDRTLPQYVTDLCGWLETVEIATRKCDGI